MDVKGLTQQQRDSLKLQLEELKSRIVRARLESSEHETALRVFFRLEEFFERKQFLTFDAIVTTEEDYLFSFCDFPRMVILEAMFTDALEPYLPHELFRLGLRTFFPEMEQRSELLTLVFPEIKRVRLELRDYMNQMLKEIRQVRAVLKKEKPELIAIYDQWDGLNESRKELFRSYVYQLHRDFFRVVGLSAMFDKRAHPWFKGSFVSLLKKVFAKAKFNALGFGLDWSTKERQIDSVRFVLKQKRPELFDIYTQWPHLMETAKEAFRQNIYETIHQGHFRVWGIGLAIRHFGSYVAALQNIFPEANLNPLGFSLDWSSHERSQESIRYILRKERPHLMEKYQLWEQLTFREQELIKEEAYRITFSHLRLWGLRGALNRKETNGSYKNVLMNVFKKAELTHHGFEEMAKKMAVKRYRWTDGMDFVVENITDAFRLHAPHLLDKYEAFELLTSVEKEAFRQQVYKITHSHFSVWGIGAALNRNIVKEFKGSHVAALQYLFKNAGLNPLGFALHWGSVEQTINSVFYVLNRELPELMRLYCDWDELEDSEKEWVRQHIYQIDKAHFSAWGLAPSVRLAEFEGSYINVLQAVFPKAELSRFGFVFDWKTKEDGLASCRYVLKRERPKVMSSYERWDQLTPLSKEQLQQSIFNITKGHFRIWGLGTALMVKSAPYFKGSLIVALQELFSKIDLDPLGFSLQWHTKALGIASVLYVLKRRCPQVVRAYEKWELLVDRDQLHFRQELKNVSWAQFHEWGLNTAVNKKVAPYFGGKIHQVFENVFPKAYVKEKKAFHEFKESRGLKIIEEGLVVHVNFLKRELKRLEDERERIQEEFQEALGKDSDDRSMQEQADVLALENELNEIKNTILDHKEEINRLML